MEEFLSMRLSLLRGGMEVNVKNISDPVNEIFGYRPEICLQILVCEQYYKGYKKLDKKQK